MGLNAESGVVLMKLGEAAQLLPAKQHQILRLGPFPFNQVACITPSSISEYFRTCYEGECREHRLQPRKNNKISALVTCPKSTYEVLPLQVPGGHILLVLCFLLISMTFFQHTKALGILSVNTILQTGHQISLIRPG